MTIRGAILDVDGTVVRGDVAVAGAREGLDGLAAAGIRRLFVSNNPTKAPQAYVTRLGRAGFDVTADEVVTAGTVSARYLADERAGDDVYLLGEDGLREQFREAGVRLVDDPECADVYVVSIDREFGYDDLCDALWALTDDRVAFVGTDPDAVIPGAERDVPGSGAVIGAVAAVTGRDPDVVLGKPSAQARSLVLDRLGLPPEECLVVGDRLDTDVALGASAGMTTVLVTTGISDRSDVATADVTPDYVVDSLAELESIVASG